jgi:predicted nucleic acid-binding Zn ribbon protein
MAHLDYLDYPDPPLGEWKKCPYCAEKIQPDAKVCRYCNRSLTQDNRRSSGTRKIVGYLILVPAMLYGLWFVIWFLSEMGGFGSVVFGFLCFPVAGLVPLYAGIAYGLWFPALVVYGGGLLASYLLRD